MAESNRGDWKQKLFIGVEIPLPWLIGISTLLLFNAGIIYTQFNDLKEVTRQFGGRIDAVERRADSAESRDIRISDRNTETDKRVEDHERRIRDIERKTK